jgi:RNA polymerase sigma-32 factor
LADEFGVSRERVRQIEVRAFEKVQKAVKHRVAIDQPAFRLALSPQMLAETLRAPARAAA